jgi:cell division protein FtsW
MMKYTNSFSSSSKLIGATDTSKEVWFSIRALFLVTAILTTFGLTMLYSVSYGVAGVKYFTVQLSAVSAGLAGGVIIFMLGYREIASKALIWCGIMFLVLMFTAFFFRSINGASRWIRYGSISVQPSEFAKIAIAIFVAKYCADNIRTFSLLKHRRGLLPLLGVLALMLGGIACGKDLGTTLLISIVAFATLLAAGLYLRYMSIPICLLPVAGIMIYLMNENRRIRMTSFLNPEKLGSKEGYQLLNSLYALGSGNWGGTGFMTSKFKSGALPEFHTDFILAIVGEELGLIAMLSVILLYVLYGYFSLKIALCSESRLGMLLGFALSCGITLQAAINLLAVSGSAPTKGMPAPFISYGGSNLISCLLATALILSIGFDQIEPGYSDKLTSKLPWNRKRR